MTADPARPERRRRSERGATATELAILMPALLLLVMLPMQIGLWWHAKAAAETAAEEALDAAQVATATAGDGRAGARAILGQSGNLRNVSVDVQRSDDTVSVVVHGDLGFSIFPGSWSVTARAGGPVERFVAEPDR